MSKLNLYLLICILSLYLSQNEETTYENTLRLLASKAKEKSQKKAEDSKQSAKLLQTLYSDSYSNNFYYTTLYISDKQIKQTYLIDTGSSIMSSPCAPCEYCGKQKNNYFDASK